MGAIILAFLLVLNLARAETKEGERDEYPAPQNFPQAPFPGGAEGPYVGASSPSIPWLWNDSPYAAQAARMLQHPVPITYKPMFKPGPASPSPSDPLQESQMRSQQEDMNDAFARLDVSANQASNMGWSLNYDQRPAFDPLSEQARSQLKFAGSEMPLFPPAFYQFSVPSPPPVLSPQNPEAMTKDALVHSAQEDAELNELERQDPLTLTDAETATLAKQQAQQLQGDRASIRATGSATGRIPASSTKPMSRSGPNAATDALVTPPPTISVDKLSPWSLLEGKEARDHAEPAPELSNRNTRAPATSGRTNAASRIKANTLHANTASSNNNAQVNSAAVPSVSSTSTDSSLAAAARLRANSVMHTLRQATNRRKPSQ